MPEPAAGSEGARARAFRLWRGMAAGLVAGLGAEYVLGMSANFWFTVPSTHPGSHASNYFAGVVHVAWWALRGGAAPMTLFRLHVTLGVLLGLGAAAALAAAVAARRPAGIWAAAVGLAGVAGAGFNGASFANYGHDFSSLLMALAWLIAWIAYGLGLYAAR